MTVIKYSNVTESVGRVMVVDYTKEVANGINEIKVSSVATEENRAGKYGVMYVNLTTGQTYYEYVDRPLTQAEELDQLQTQLTTVQKNLSTIPPIDTPVTLQDYQTNKIYELNTACNQDILSGFTSEATGIAHQYKFNKDYQDNIAQDGMMLALDPTITSIDWPTKDAGVVTHTRSQFIQLCKDAKVFKDNNMYRYFGLKAQVLATTTVDQVSVFSWA